MNVEKIAGKVFRNVITLVVLVGLWHVGGVVLGSGFLPTPLEVFDRFQEILTVSGPYGHTALFHLERSLTRVLIVTVFALIIAIGLGIGMGINAEVEEGIATWLPFWMTIPTVVVVLVTMVMFDFSEMSVIAATVFAATPYATANTWEGAKNIDSDLVEMANAFNVSQLETWRHIYFPSILPYIFGSIRYLLSMVWKIVVLAETFGMNEGLGAMVRLWFGQGDLVSLFAYITLFVIVMLVFQYGLAPIESHLFKWRS